MTLRLNGSTSGYVEIDAPATAGSNTLTLPNGNGTSGQYLRTDGSGGLSWQTLPAAGTTWTSSFVNINGTTGTLFSSIPNKVRQIRITFAAVSTNSTVRVRLQLGDSGGIESSGYVYNSTYHGIGQGQLNTINDNGFTSGSWAAGPNIYTGYFLINRLTDQATTSNVTYVCNGGFEIQNDGYNAVLNGRKELSGEIDRVSFNTQDGSTTFDSGTVRIDYLS